MSRRKTIDVQMLKDIVNRRNKNSTCAPDIREGWNSLLEEALNKTGNYKGFRYTEPDIWKSDDTRRIYN